jgi:quercetin dioxygenase-like cupin family protein
VTFISLGAGAGTSYPFLGTTATIKAGGSDTDNALMVLECECQPGFATPLHVHANDDEAFYVLSGRMRLHHGDDVSEAEPGAFVLLEKGRPHAFVAVGDEPLRVLQLNWPAGFERFVADVAAMPPGPPDFDLLAELAARQGIEIVGPPPTPTG